MPDLTLYADDVETLATACAQARKAIYANATRMIVSEGEYDDIQTLERLRDLLHERLRQGLHPKRDA